MLHGTMFPYFPVHFTTGECRDSVCRVSGRAPTRPSLSVTVSVSRLCDCESLRLCVTVSVRVSLSLSECVKLN